MAGSLSLEETVLKFNEVDGLKFGDFVVRTGEHTPFYIDMRVIWSYPKIVTAVSESLWDLLSQKKLEHDTICGLPYQGIPLATYISTKYDIPMLLKRKEAKKYGTKKVMEGHFKQGQKILIVDDVLMTGASLVEDIKYFEEQGLEIGGIVVFFDREQGGAEKVKMETGHDTHCVIGINQAVDILIKAGKLTEDQKSTIAEYLKANRFDT